MSKMSELHLEITTLLEQGATPFDIQCIANELRVPYTLVKDVAESLEPENADSLFY